MCCSKYFKSFKSSELKSYVNNFSKASLSAIINSSPEFVYVLKTSLSPCSCRAMYLRKPTCANLGASFGTLLIAIAHFDSEYILRFHF